MLKVLALSEGILFFAGGALVSVWYIISGSTWQHQVICGVAILSSTAILSELVSAMIYYKPGAEESDS